MPVKTTSPVGDISRPGGSYRERDGQHSQHSYITDQHRNVWLPAGAWMTDPAGTVIPGVSGGLGSWVFLSASNDDEFVSTSVWRPSKWINGKVTIDYYLSQNASTATDMVLSYRMSSWSQGDTLAGTYDRLQDDDNVVAANTFGTDELYVISVDTTSNVVSTDEMLGVLFGMDSSHVSHDYAGNLRFFGALLTYVPTNRQ